ncbi:MAG: DNA polymerase [Bacteroidia bacterium]|nr:DNA polymerase [Bacteroidia bacterium]
MENINILTTITDLNDFFDLIDSLDKETTILAIDIETDGVKRHSKIYGIGIALNENDAYYIPIYNKFGQLFFDEYVIEMLKENLKILFSLYQIIGHNLIFDVVKIKQWLEIDLREQIVADTILMRHLLQEEGPFGLKEIASLEFKIDATAPQQKLMENIKLNNGNITKTDCEFHKADTDILGYYCCWDVLYTYKLYNLYIKKLKEEDLYNLFIEEVLPLYKKVTIKMAEHGLRIDLKLLYQLKEEIINDINILEDKIITAIKPLIEQFEKDLLDKEVPIKNKGLFAKCYAEKVGLTNLPSLSKTTIKKLTPTTPEQDEFKKFMLEEIKEPQCANDIQHTVFFKKFDNQRYVFNLRSKHHLKWLFFTKLKLSAISKTENGEPQVNDDFLESVANQFEWVKLLQDLNKLEKLRGTYIEGIIERLEGEYVYPSFLQFGTTSGRFATRNPNVQNLPRPKEENTQDSPLIIHYNNQIRKLFISKEGYVFVDADYAALEPRCFAHCSGDQNLQNIFKTGEDLYSALAIKVFNVQNASPFKKDPNFLGNIYPELRQKMKVVALAAAYGATEFRIAKLLNCPVEEAKKILDDYFSAYPGLANYINNCHKSVLTEGFVKTEFGRKRHLKLAQDISFILARKDVKTFEDAVKSNLIEEYKMLKNYLNNSTNFPIQGLAAHIVNKAMILLSDLLTNHKIDATIILQVHDQIVVEVREDQAEECVKLVKTAMENVVSLSVPLIAEPKIAKNLKDSH